MNKEGIVYLVGAGPGDPGLITVKGLECIREADVLVYDRLASPDLLKEARLDAERVFVGKASSQHTLTQDQINKLIVDRAADGKVVCRLKGGDPFLYGRGGEEAEELIAAGLHFEVVPGVTSAIAVPAYAGIPVTHRDLTSSFAVITGHEDPNKIDSSIAWDKISTGIGTLVFLMGVENLSYIVEQLTKNGRPADTPVALIRWGTRMEQETVTGTLANIVEKVRKAKLRPPAVTIVGEVVGLRQKLRWFDNKPLFGKRVLVTRTRDQASALSSLLRSHGAYPVEFPTIKIEPPADFAQMDAAIERLGEYDWVVFTSANGVKSMISRLASLGQDVRAFGKAKLSAIGPATAKELTRYGLRVDLMPEEYVAQSIIDRIGDVVGKRILLPRADIAREMLVVELNKRGAMVDEVAAYRTVQVDSMDAGIVQMLNDGVIDVITFTSSSTVQNFLSLLEANCELAGENRAQWLSDLFSAVTIACIGPITAKTAVELGLRVDIVAEDYTIPGLVEAIVARERQREGKA
ncbi:MAG: uroporphyrinogen-III C-methyltransferase [Dehalococcoidia bacterium]|nr:uroporphyrinogen-III C-methyltransferase [Dehalococcoidia bacterium]